MEIEITTTKKKLTKSIVRQIQTIAVPELFSEYARGFPGVLGYFNDRFPTVLIKLASGEHRVATMKNWYAVTGRPICEMPLGSGRGCRVLRLPSAETAELYAVRANEMNDAARQKGQIYL